MPFVRVFQTIILSKYSECLSKKSCDYLSMLELNEMCKCLLKDVIHHQVRRDLIKTWLSMQLNCENVLKSVLHDKRTEKMLWSSLWKGKVWKLQHS